MSERHAVRIVKKNKNNLPICLRYGYVIKYGLAKKFKILGEKLWRSKTSQTSITR
ncbi:hypothetical protein [uncultured Campylobacter sp.]|uniref:hypothetical protein n=1 Tax=uncultured Campylobacter sp. TaxID=218934 RepID=UPI002608DA8B|nr:hypothetical protein [uncultured Campylobacter sp.]